ncbi:MAG: family 16 glycosylhydrolase [Bacteroidetes bacterium]|nr:family 16 glycosylhydrolase [Bacteroidota bacterium]
MKIIKIIGITVITVLLFINKAKAQLPSMDPAYQLVWADSFPGTYGVRIDASKWNQLWPWNQADSVAQSMCDTNIHYDIAYDKWYLATPGDYLDTTNCKINGGNLNQYCRKQNFSGDCWTWPSCNPLSNCNGWGYCDIPLQNKCWHRQNKFFKYTGTNLISKYKFKYGYFEMRFKTPPAATYPNRYSTSTNFWLWANDSIMPWSEIDIMEKRDSDNWVTSNLHYNHYPESGNVPLHNEFFNNGQISANSWHTVGCLWTNARIVFYLDGVEVNHLTKSDIHPDSLLAMPIIIGIGGPAGNFCQLFNPTYSLDYNWQIDYVKVWQINKDCNTAKTYCNNYNPIVSKLYQSVTLDGSTCSDAITNTNYTSLYGTNYVLLNEGFSIDNNSAVLMDILDCNSTIQNNIMSSGLAPTSFVPKNKKIPTQ